MDNLSGKKIGIFGGSFDPIHNGHIAIAKNALQEFQLDEIWFIPAGHSPNKEEKNMTDPETRAAMVQLAIKEIPQFKLSRMEIESEHTSYTYLTLTKLKEWYPDTTFFFLMGADSLDYFDKWYHPEIICQKAIILVAVREHLLQKEIQKKIDELKILFDATIFPLSCKKVDVSSHELRESFLRNDQEHLLLPDSVKDFIIKNHLYQGI